jgi:hypothetical protein
MRLASNTPSLRYGNYTFFGVFGFAKTSLEDWMVRAYNHKTVNLQQLKTHKWNWYQSGFNEEASYK